MKRILWFWKEAVIAQYFAWVFLTLDHQEIAGWNPAKDSLFSFLPEICLLAAQTALNSNSLKVSYHNEWPLSIKSMAQSNWNNILLQNKDKSMNSKTITPFQFHFDRFFNFGVIKSNDVDFVNKKTFLFCK